LLTETDTMTMNITMMIALALALSAAPSVDAIRTHRRATGTELYRVQPTQKVMPVADASPMNAADFEKLDGDAKRYVCCVDTRGHEFECMCLLYIAFLLIVADYLHTPFLY
jgi:hypothetical protein